MEFCKLHPRNIADGFHLCAECMNDAASAAREKELKHRLDVITSHGETLTRAAREIEAAATAFEGIGGVPERLEESLEELTLRMKVTLRLLSTWRALSASGVER